MDSENSNPLDKLNERQRKFVIEYLACLNGTEAARRAGYSEDSARSIASENLTKPDIKAAISYLGEELGMSAGEAVLRMSKWSKGSLEPFLLEDGSLSLNSELARENIGLIKKYKRRKEVRSAEDGSWTSETETVELELYDAKDATDKILQLHGRYKQLPGDANQPKELQAYKLPSGETIIF